MRYFARVTAGLEAIAWQDIQQRTGATLIGFGHRRIDFRYEGPAVELLNLKSVDDLYLFVTQLRGFDRSRASLTHFQRLGDMDFADDLKLIATLRDIGEPPTFAITASHLGKRNYSRYDVEAAVEKALSRLGWSFVPNLPEVEESHDIDLRILIEDDWALVGFRLGDSPLHRRAYKRASVSGSLKAPVAYCLALLAELPSATDMLILDPTCGAGTILIEAAHLISEGRLVGIDIEPAAIAAAAENSGRAGVRAEIVPNDVADHLQHAIQNDAPPLMLLYNGNIRNTPFSDNPIQAIIANLPWGKQVEPGMDLFPLYYAILQLAETNLDRAGRVVLLTDQVETMQKALAQCPTLVLASTFQISLFGSHPTVYLIHKDLG